MMNQELVNAFAEKAIKVLAENITEYVGLAMEKNPELKAEYNKLIGDNPENQEALNKLLTNVFQNGAGMLEVLKSEGSATEKGAKLVGSLLKDFI